MTAPVYRCDPHEPVVFDLAHGYVGDGRPLWWLTYPSLPTAKDRFAPDLKHPAVMFQCPMCGEKRALQSSEGGHQIDDDGKVWPAIKCHRPRCTFQVYGRLREWRKLP